VGWSNGGISNCFSTGDVTGGDHAYYVGGLVGINPSEFGNINDSYSTGAVSGGSYSLSIGGLVGGNCTGSIISNCYSTGAVTGWDILGGLLGWNSTYGIISGSYFLNTSGPNNGYGAPLMEAQMKQQANFVGWDFAPIGPNDIWTIKETVDYPKLVWPMVNLVSSRFPLGWYEVDFADFAAMANWWGRTDCAANNDCEGADFDFSGTVDERDLAVICNYWLQGL
jgi:hypothetical protein